MYFLFDLLIVGACVPNADAAVTIYIYTSESLCLCSGVACAVVPSAALRDKMNIRFAAAPLEHDRAEIENRQQSGREGEAAIEEARREILHAFQQLGREAGLPVWEIPRVVAVETHQDWSNWNGLLSSIGKPCRPAIRRRCVVLIQFYLPAAV
jgi:hypothetical protein